MQAFFSALPAMTPHRRDWFLPPSHFDCRWNKVMPSVLLGRRRMASTTSSAFTDTYGQKLHLELSPTRAWPEAVVCMPSIHPMQAGHGWAHGMRD